MASSAPPFSAGTESEPILRAGPFSFPFMHRGVMSRRKQMDEKIHHRQYRFSVITIEGAHQQYDHDLKRRKKKRKSGDSPCYPSTFALYRRSFNTILSKIDTTM